MEFTHVLIRFGELYTKGKNKHIFIDTLYENIKRKLRNYKNLKYIKHHDRIFIELNGESVEGIREDLELVSGLYSYSFVTMVESNIDSIISKALEFVDESTGTFKVFARRSDKNFPFVSDDINRKVASAILTKWGHCVGVDVHEPKLSLYIEVRREGTYLFTEKCPGLGGYPLGVGGKAMLLISGGIDSPVAGFLLNKRGITFEAVHFAAPPYTSTMAIQKVKDLLSKLTCFQKKIRLHIIPFTDIQLKIYENSDESYAITIMRRMMYRIATKLAQQEKCLALASGESIGQVASQTLESMNVINEVTNMPMIRPLATMDKVDIIKESKRIGTYDISILPYEDCCTIFTPKNPVTKPRLDLAKRYEEKFDFETMIDEAIEKREVVVIKDEEEVEFL